MYGLLSMLRMWVYILETANKFDSETRLEFWDNEIVFNLQDAVKGVVDKNEKEYYEMLEYFIHCMSTFEG